MLSGRAKIRIVPLVSRARFYYDSLDRPPSCVEITLTQKFIFPERPTNNYAASLYQQYVAHMYPLLGRLDLIWD